MQLVIGEQLFHAGLVHDEQGLVVYVWVAPVLVDALGLVFPVAIEDESHELGNPSLA